nr:hypothetical protein CFP56_59887 [Quercus suber]
MVYGWVIVAFWDWVFKVFDCIGCKTKAFSEASYNDIVGGLWGFMARESGVMGLDSDCVKSELALTSFCFGKISVSDSIGIPVSGCVVVVYCFALGGCWYQLA